MLFQALPKQPNNQTTKRRRAKKTENSGQTMDRVQVHGILHFSVQQNGPYHGVCLRVSPTSEGIKA
ncbi:MAG: hypothetical protein CBE00_06440 [Planctomycetaceae bacterium TMED240]|nr:hypothetical protein [Rhodopirellula sp.]OUX06803.1 MAG: hypothetical protein CBE00_06440 [Planctomycetaceae bacterium TMED240]